MLYRVFTAGFGLSMGSLASAGPDLICSEIASGQTYGAVGDYQAYSFGDSTCNIGDTPFTYNANSPDHPVFTTSLFRLQDGQFHQIGISYVSHTFFPLQGNSCDLGCNPGSLGMLGAGCSDAIGAGLAGSQTDMGPRIEVDPWSGGYPYPFSTINQTGNAVDKRLKATVTDLSDPSALYFVERQYISNEELPEDRLNNSSYCRVFFTPASNSPRVQGDTFAQRPAIYAWQDHGLGADTADPNVMISSVFLPDDGLVYVGSRATEMDDGTWRYDYAIQNQNASKGVNAFRILFDSDIEVTQPTFHDIEYIDEIDNQIDGTDWTFSTPGDMAQWTLGENAIQNPMGNAIRWGTMYSFSFVSENPPNEATIELGVFASDNESVLAFAIAPENDDCAADFNDDGMLNFFDVTLFIQSHLNGDDFNGDGSNNYFDVSYFIQLYFSGCN